jgi:hypothetical protein
MIVQRNMDHMQHISVTNPQLEELENKYVQSW